MKQQLTAIILAGGLGKRLGGIDKVLLEIAGHTLLERTIKTLTKSHFSQIIIVANPNNVNAIKKIVSKNVDLVVQKQALGTLDAASVGFGIVKNEIENVAVLYGDDSAFYKPDTINKVILKHLISKSNITFVTIDKEDPTGLGRIIRKNGKVAAIVEEKDATLAQKEIKEVNDGLYIFDKSWFLKSCRAIKPSKATGEFYLTDLIELTLQQDRKIETYKLENPNEWHGINTHQELEEARLKYEKRIHIMGIAGSGAAATAAIAKSNGYQVDGCDLAPESTYASNLEGIKVAKGHNSSHLENINMLLNSPAIEKFDSQNTELKEAKKKNIPILTWQKFQGKYLQEGKLVITVTGAYGKSTTTAMISQILTDAGFDPTCEIGATVLSWNKNFRVGDSKYYVCEADEYNDNFLNYQSDIAMILNAAWDHPDYFKTKEKLLASYGKYVSKIKKNGVLVIGNDDNLEKIIKFSRKDIKIVKIKAFSPYKLSIIGHFREENADAALSIAQLLNIDPTLAKNSVENFKGLARRLEYKGQKQNVKVYDDYAVQPYTIKTTANALKEQFENKTVVLVLEPHTYSRIKTFFNDFVKNLKETKVDHVFITNIYAAREKAQDPNLPQELAFQIGKKAKYTGSIEETANYLKSHLKDFDVILSMGAGKVYRLWDIL